MDLKIEEFEFIGRNDYWQFAVGRCGDRWLGLALEGMAIQAAREAFRSEGLECQDPYMHIFSEVSDGTNLGMLDKRKAILLVGALAQDSEHDFGGIYAWLVPEELRGKPEDFRCATCGDVGCDGRRCCEEDYHDDEYSV